MKRLLFLLLFLPIVTLAQQVKIYSSGSFLVLERASTPVQYAMSSQFDVQKTGSYISIYIVNVQGTDPLRILKPTIYTDIDKQDGSAAGATADLTVTYINGLITAGGAASVPWGGITGTLSAQTDLNSSLGAKAPLASPTFTGTVTTAGFTAVANTAGVAAISISDVATGTGLFANSTLQTMVFGSGDLQDFSLENCFILPQPDGKMQVMTADAQSNQTILDIDPAGSNIFTDGKAVKTGLEYASSGYVTQTHSLTDKAYVDGAGTFTGTKTLNSTSSEAGVIFPSVGTVSAATTGAMYRNGNNLQFNSNSTQWIIPRVLTGSNSIDFPSTAAGAVANGTITVTGAAVGDVVALGANNTVMTTTAVYFAWVSATNTVTVRFSPKATEDPVSDSFRVIVYKIN